MFLIAMSSRAPPPPRSATRVRPRPKPDFVLCLSTPRCHMGVLTQQLGTSTRSGNTSRPSSPSIHSGAPARGVSDYSTNRYCVGSQLICNLRHPLISTTILYVYAILGVFSSLMSEGTDLAPTLALALASSGSGCWPSPPRQAVAHLSTVRCPLSTHAALAAHAAMSDRDTTCPPVSCPPPTAPKSKLSRHPGSLPGLADGRCRCTLRMAKPVCVRNRPPLPPLHTCMHATLCHSRGWKKHWDEAKALIITQKNTSG